MAWQKIGNVHRNIIYIHKRNYLLNDTDSCIFMSIKYYAVHKILRHKHLTIVWHLLVWIIKCPAINDGYNICYITIIFEQYACIAVKRKFCGDKQKDKNVYKIFLHNHNIFAKFWKFPRKLARTHSNMSTHNFLISMLMRIIIWFIWSQILDIRFKRTR